jgi:hypothetical protein
MAITTKQKYKSKGGIKMTFKEQLIKLKENWLLAVLIIVVLLVVSFAGSESNLLRGVTSNAYGGVMMESAIAPSTKMSYAMDSGFAPQVQDRKITKSTWMSADVKRGEFKAAEEQLKNVVKSADAYLLNENSNLYGEGKTAYYSGSYQIKVETQKYDAVVSQLKLIGEVTSFNENAADITETYVDLKTQLELEQSRLKKYQDMYAEATNINDKIQLTNSIFDQERTIKYLQDSLNNVNQKVDYSTISVSLTEKQSSYANIVVVTFGQLITSLVDSFNTLLKLIFVVLPYAIAAGLIWLVVKLTRSKKRK